VPTVEDGRHFYTLQEEPLEDPLHRVVKRACDLAVALPVVVLVLPPLGLAVWLMQRVQAPGPLLHVRERLGQGGRPFRMLKFRTMHAAAADAAAEARQARAEDERVFPCGRFLRRRSLDEFPQFWNVLVGDMSLVGPRPERPYHVEQLADTIPHYLPRHLVKPGMTGWAQVNGLRGDSDLAARVQHDIYYIENWSIWLDVQIVLLTFVRWRSTSAY
jgi:putative colanic acid biosynthesis UDP-glucose lipid carrier transferase